MQLTHAKSFWQALVQQYIKRQRALAQNIDTRGYAFRTKVREDRTGDKALPGPARVAPPLLGRFTYSYLVAHLQRRLQQCLGMLAVHAGEAQAGVLPCEDKLLCSSFTSSSRRGDPSSKLKRATSTARIATSTRWSPTLAWHRNRAARRCDMVPIHTVTVLWMVPSTPEALNSASKSFSTACIETPRQEVRKGVFSRSTAREASAMSCVRFSGLLSWLGGSLRLQK